MRPNVSSLTRWLWPKINGVQVMPMLRFAALGAVIAGVFGAVHDQVTYTISPEYFSRMKFSQFAYADFGWPTRVFVAEIGFLASWWVGFFVGWFLGRTALPRFAPEEAKRKVNRGFLITFGCASAGAVIGWLIGNTFAAEPPAAIAEVAANRGVQDVTTFTKVACIHYGSYGGAALGTLISLLRARLSRRVANV
jgi:hypothetical protein